MSNLVLYKPGIPSWVTYARRRVLRENKNFLAIINGPTGSGKTWSGLSYAEMIDPKFTVNNVAFDFDEFLDIIHDPEFLKRNPKVVLFDEPQNSISNRKWQSKINQYNNYILSTFRSDNIIVIYCSPYKDFLDSQSAKLIHAQFKTMSIDKKRSLVIVNPKLLDYNDELDKTYKHNLYVVRKGYGASPLNTWAIPKPSESLIAEYEKRKSEYVNKLKEDIMAKRKKEIDSEKPAPTAQAQYIAPVKGADYRKPLTARQREVLITIAMYGGDVLKAAKHLGINESTVYGIRGAASRRGYQWKEYVPNENSKIEIAKIAESYGEPIQPTAILNYQVDGSDKKIPNQIEKKEVKAE